MPATPSLSDEQRIVDSRAPEGESTRLNMPSDARVVLFEIAWEMAKHSQKGWIRDDFDDRGGRRRR